jgi:hypothetical protein
MESLPLEIWYNIFSPFSLKEKMECMSVCRSWWKYFDKYTLLSHIEIKDNCEQFTAFMDMIKRLPHRKLQIDTLELDNCLPQKLNKRRLFNIFSTVRVLRVLNDKDTSYKRTLQRKPLKTLPSHSQVEFLTDSYYCELASQVLVSNRCDRLDTLQLDLFGLESVNSIFHELRFAPVLQQLSLRSAAISLEDLEIMHENTPSLKALKLEWVYITRGNGYPSNIVPAACLTTLHFTVYDTTELDTHILFYKYIKQKYVNVRDIKHKDAIRYTYDYGNRTLFDVNGYLDFLELVAQRQGRSYLNKIQDETDSFEVMSPADPRLPLSSMTATDLDIYLSQPNQFQNIHTLTLNNTEPNAPDVLKYMPVLTTLKLHFTRRNDPLHIDLTPYFNGCPDSVKSFDIDCFQVVFDPSIIRRCYIESLNVNCNVIIPQFHYLVEKCLPALLRLKLAGAVVQRVGCSLDNHHPLEEFTLDLDRKNPQAFIFKDCERCDTYLCNSEGTRLATWDDIEGLPLMTVRSFRPGRFVVDIQDVIRIVLA